MGGLQRLFLRITPIIMLICFICFGITHAFQGEEQANITYLTHETIEVIADNPLTEENEQVTIENYNFDFKSYRDNIDIDILKRSTENIINITAYHNTLNRFNMIWDDGYNFGDGIQTIANIGILVINTLILPINIVLAPLRIISGILLTAFSIVGININRQTPIINALNGILDNAAIPFINPTYNREYLDNYNGTTWLFNNAIDLTNKTDVWNMTINVNFTSEGGGNYTKIIVNKANNTITYVDTQNYQIQVYNLQQGWIYTDSQKITINQNNTLSREDWNNLTALLSTFATEIAN